MSEQEILDQIRALTPAELAQVQGLITRLRAERGRAAEADSGPHTADEAWALLERGWCHGGGRPLADTVDEALYGERA